jgi:hypothetical protein
MQGRIRIPLRSAISATLWVLIAILAFSCSDSEEPLWWEESSRGGLGAVLDTVDTGDLFIADSSYHHIATTGLSSYLMVGQVDRGEPTGNVMARTYLRWDVSELYDAVFTGTVVQAHVKLIYRGLDQADTAASANFKLEMLALTDDSDTLWTEDNLGIDVVPTIGELLGVVNDFDLEAAPDTSDMVFVQKFMHVDLAHLVREWVLDETPNNGVVLQTASTSVPRGFMRFVSSEGIPELTAETAVKVQLTVVVDPGGDAEQETTTFEAADDAYLITAENDDTQALHWPLPFDDETSLLLSSGYIKRIVLTPDLKGYVAENPTLFPPGTAIHQAALILTVADDEEWFLDDQDELTIQVYEADSVWHEGEPFPEWSPDGLSSKTFTGEDTEIVLDVHAMAQEVLEGENRALIVRCETETGAFKSILFHGRTAAAELRPRLRLIISHPGDGRLDPWSE